ncbi:hypothetical protein [Demequina rhizosphaerae]|uniref:hypothetical protein n=1 Tax=Demequina rhizosphaerae TaxID=1638985 RepID=UPI0007828201|nr:hypothetical protein [Demequina rhizosphaerae]
MTITPTTAALAGTSSPTASTTPDTAPETTPPALADTTTEAGTDTTADTPEPSEQTSANVEAAKWRRQLRDTEAERDGLRERVDALLRADAERQIADKLLRPDALWTAGVALADVLDESGAIDPAKLFDATADAVARLGLAAPARTPRPDASQGGGKGGSSGSGWVDAMRV